MVLGEPEALKSSTFGRPDFRHLLLEQVVKHRMRLSFCPFEPKSILFNQICLQKPLLSGEFQQPKTS